MVRVVGLCWVVVGLGGVLMSVLVEDPLPVERTISGNVRLDGTVIFGVVLVLGALMLVLRPYRPDLGDEVLSDEWRERLGIYPPAYETPPKFDPSQKRSWWTGDPVTLPRKK